jgi:zinc protease
VRSGLSWKPEESYTLTVSFGSDPERAEEMVAAVFGEIERLQAAPPDEEEVSDTREALERSFETDFQSNRTWLGQLVSDYQRGEEPGASVLSYEATVEALTPEAIQDAAIRFFNTDNYVHVTLLPEE